MIHRVAIELRVGERPRLNARFPVHLDALQEFVGGYIECVNLERLVIRVLEERFQCVLGRRACIVCNDEFLAMGLPINPLASVIAGVYLAGDALIVDVP